MNITQLFFGLPPEFKSSPRDEKPNLIFKSLAPPLVPHDPLVPGQPPPIPRGETLSTSDDRPERILIDKVLSDGTIRILLSEPGLGFPEGIFWLGVLTPLSAGLRVGGVAALAALVGV